MEVKLPEPGVYIVAVSGGVDSMSMLHLLTNNSELLTYNKEQGPKVTSSKLPVKSFRLIVAHFNHGIRNDSDKDEKLVRRIATKYNLVCEVGYGNLGKNASEEQARKARYKFLFDLKKKYGAKAVITAHHQDDLIETAVINILRGTGWRGLVAMQRNTEVMRPLLDLPKQKLVEYAIQNNLEWREDETNLSSQYLRNRVRGCLETKMTQTQRRQLLKQVNHIEKLSSEISDLIANISQYIDNEHKLNRHNYCQLPTLISREVLYGWLNANNVDELDSTLIERLDVFIRAGKPGNKTNLGSKWFLLLDKEFGYITYP